MIRIEKLKVFVFLYMVYIVQYFGTRGDATDQYTPRVLLQMYDSGCPVGNQPNPYSPHFEVCQLLRDFFDFGHQENYLLLAEVSEGQCCHSLWMALPSFCSSLFSSWPIT